MSKAAKLTPKFEAILRRKIEENSHTWEDGQGHTYGYVHCHRISPNTLRKIFNELDELREQVKVIGEVTWFKDFDQERVFITPEDAEKIAKAWGLLND